MPDTTIITAPEGTHTTAIIESYIDGNGELAFRTDTGTAISTHVDIGCDQEQTVRTIIEDFTEANGTSWTVSASPALQSTTDWTRGNGEIYDKGRGWTDYVEVTVTAEHTNANGETTTKTKKIHVKTTSRTGLPGGRPKL